MRARIGYSSGPKEPHGRGAERLRGRCSRPPEHRSVRAEPLRASRRGALPPPSRGTTEISSSFINEPATLVSRERTTIWEGGIYSPLRLTIMLSGVFFLTHNEDGCERDIGGFHVAE